MKAAFGLRADFFLAGFAGLAAFFAAGFLFQGDDVFKKIKVLSGGEKARVSLAKIVTTGSNFLILDEPTNHLDMQSIEILIEVMNNYNGSYIIVSHDRHFISKTANKIWWIEDFKIKEYPGTYSEFETSQNSKAKFKAKDIVKTSADESTKSSKKQTINTDKSNENTKRNLQNNLDNLEKIIENTKEKITDSELFLASEEVYKNPDKFKEIMTLVSSLKSELEINEKEFEKVFDELLKFE